MPGFIPQRLGLIAGKGAYPLMLAESAKRGGVEHLFVAAFKGETERSITRHADSIKWLAVGQFSAMLEAMRGAGVTHAVMAGQITPANLFRARPDAKILGILLKLPRWNADTIFGAIADELRGIGVELLPAWMFMEDAMPQPGLIGGRPPTPAEEKDIALGFEAAKAVSALNIGQTVAVKQGAILAVEAFEGTDEAILRAGRLGGPGAVVVKTARKGHDMRFDIPVVGMRTFKALRKARAAVLAVEAGRTILLERDRLAREAQRLGMAFTAVALDGREAG